MDREREEEIGPDRRTFLKVAGTGALASAWTSGPATSRVANSRCWR